MIVDPWGRIVAEAEREPGVIFADIDPEISLKTRKRIPALANQRSFTPPAAAKNLETVS